MADRVERALTPLAARGLLRAKRSLSRPAALRAGERRFDAHCHDLGEAEG